MRTSTNVIEKVELIKNYAKTNLNDSCLNRMG